MSKHVKFFAALVLLAGAIAITPGTAFAQRHHGGGHHGGGWHGGGGGHGGGGWRGGGWGGGGWGPGFGYPYGLLPTPYYYGGPYYYDRACGWVRVRVLRRGHWVLRRAWRCW
jgi:hypothetical protein